MQKLFLIALLNLGYSVAHAQCESTAEVRRAAMQLNGVDGIWFHLDVARCILAEVEELRIRRREIALLEGRLRATDALASTLQATIENQTASNRELEQALHETREQMRPREWWESPFFWTPLALVLGAAGGIVLGVWAGR